MMPMAQLNHTAFAGVCVCLFTLFQYLLNGKQSSKWKYEVRVCLTSSSYGHYVPRAYAKVTLDAAIIQPCPIEKPARIVNARIAKVIFCVMHCIR